VGREESSALAFSFVTDARTGACSPAEVRGCRRSGSDHCGHGEWPKFGRELFGVEASACGSKVERGQFEVLVLGPVRQDTQQVLSPGTDVPHVSHFAAQRSLPHEGKPSRLCARAPGCVRCMKAFA
jgi:hypothetical protein